MALQRTTQGVGLESLQIAHELAQRGARTSVIEILAGVTQAQARQVIREVSGADPRSGLLPLCAATMISTRRRHAEASIAASFYDIFKISDDPSISARALIESWDTYMLVSGHEDQAKEQCASRRRHISITEMYVLARDMRIGAAEVRRCQVCFSRWLYCVEATRYTECPHCRLLSEQTCQCGKPKSTRSRYCLDCQHGDDPAWPGPLLRAPLLSIPSQEY